MLTNERNPTAWDMLETQEGGALEKMFLLKELCQLQALYYDQYDEEHQSFGHESGYTMEMMKRLSEEIPTDLEGLLRKLKVIQ